MRITRDIGVKDTVSARRKEKTSKSEGSFADNLRETQSSAGSGMAQDPGGISGAEAILATQNVGDFVDDAPRRKRLTEFADDILDRLDELRSGILLGEFPKDHLAELAQKLRQKRLQSADPELNEIIQEIELRAEVEVAKYSRRPRSDLI